MPSKRIILGVDSELGLTFALESSSPDVFHLVVLANEGEDGEIVRFLCSAKALHEAVDGSDLTLFEGESLCTILSVGERLRFSFKVGEQIVAVWSINSSSLSRLVTMIQSRAYAS